MRAIDAAKEFAWEHSGQGHTFRVVSIVPWLIECDCGLKFDEAENLTHYIVRFPA